MSFINFQSFDPFLENKEKTKTCAVSKSVYRSDTNTLTKIEQICEILLIS